VIIDQIDFFVKIFVMMRHKDDIIIK